MPRTPGVILETTGRLNRSTKAKFYRDKHITLEQKKKIIQVHQNNKNLGVRALSKKIKFELDLNIGKTALFNILKSQDFIKNVKTTPRTTRTKKISPIYESFRNRLFDVIVAESTKTCIHNANISEFAVKIRKDAIYSSDKTLARLKFTNRWIDAYKKDFALTYRRIVGKQFMVNQTEVDKCRVELRELMQEYEPSNIINFDESRFVPWASLSYGNFPVGFHTAKKYRNDEKMAYSCGAFISASGVASLPIFISSSVPRNPFLQEKSKIKNLEIENNGIVRKESARIFHIDHNGVKKEALFMKSSRGWMTANLFSYLLRFMDQKFRAEGRQVLLLLGHGLTFLALISLFFIGIQKNFMP